MQGNQVEVLDETRKLSAKNSEAQADRKANSQIDVRKMLSESHLKGALQINFENVLFDLFAPAQRIVVADAPRPVEAKQIDVVPLPQIRHIDSPNNRESQLKESKEGNAPAPIDRSAKTEDRGETTGSENDSADDGSSQEAASAEDGADKSGKTSESKKKSDVDEKKSDGSELAGQVKILRVELSAQLQRSLTADEIDDLAGKIDALLSEENIDLSQLVAGVVAIVEELIARVTENVQSAVVDTGAASRLSIGKEVLDLFGFVGEDDGENMRRYMKGFLKGLKESLTVQEQSATAGNSKVDEAVESKVDDALLRLFKKLDKPERLERVEVKSAAPEAEDRPEVSESKQAKTESVARVIKREAPRVENTEFKERIQESVERPSAERMSERQVADFVSVRKSARPSYIVSAPAQAVGTVGESGGAGKSGDSAGQQLWQNSYNNSASQKGLNVAKAAPPRPAAPLPSPNQIMDQIVQQTRIVIEDGRGEATIKLQPESLGKVEMKVTVDGDKANVRFVVENMNVRLAIMENVEDLRKNLEYLGLEVEQLSVMLQGEMGDAEDGDEPGDKDGGKDLAPAGWNLEEDEEAGERLRELTEAERDGSTVRYLV